MKKRKNKKTFRIIELILKLGVFIGIVTLILIGKSKSSSTPDALPNTFPDTSSPASTYIISMEGLSQDGIPTGCESVSTVALLHYLGIKITTDQFIDSFLPCKGFYRENGVLYGPNPHEYFAGNPYEKSSLGCYPDVILKALRSMQTAKYPGVGNLTFRNVTGTDLQTLIEEYINNEIPVLLWVTIDMKESREGMKYYLDDGTLYTWTAQEHCVVLCGYNKENYYIMDPLADGEIVGYAKQLVEQRYNEMGKYAIVCINTLSL